MPILDLDEILVYLINSPCHVTVFRHKGNCYLKLITKDCVYQINEEQMSFLTQAGYLQLVGLDYPLEYRFRIFKLNASKTNHVLKIFKKLTQELPSIGEPIITSTSYKLTLWDGFHLYYHLFNDYFPTRYRVVHKASLVFLSEVDHAKA